MPLPRLFAAVLGLALPLTLATAVEAAPRHRGPAQVQTATYRVAQHRAHRNHAQHASRHQARRVAQARHHSIMRGS